MNLPWNDLPALTPWAGAILTAVGVLLALLVLKRVVVRRVARLTGLTDTRVDDNVIEAVRGTHFLVLLTVAAWIGAAVWLPESAAERWASRVGTLALLGQVGAWASLLVKGLAARRREEAVASGRAGDATAWTALAFLARLAVWSLLGLVALDNLGVDVTALVAGLGIGGLAIGLAVQNVLGDLLASLAIVLDRPFALGDFLVVGDVAGTVEHVGLKTTRVRALSGEEVVLSNADLLGSRIRNYKSLQERRVVLTFGVLFDTPPDVLARLPHIVRELVEAHEGARFDRAHLFRLGESSIDYEVVYILASPDYNRHMDVQQAILLGLLRRFGDMDVGFAFPTRTLYLHEVRAEGEAEEDARAGA